MLLFSAIIAVYFLVLLCFLQIAQLYDITIVSSLFIIVTSILYSMFIYVLPKKSKKIVNTIFIFLACLLSFGNIFYYYIKHSILTISLLSLLDELAGVSDSVTGYFDPIYLLILVLPLIVSIVSNKTIDNIKSRFSNIIIIATVGLLAVLNVSFYLQDDLLYTTIYSPIDYAKEFGFISFYAREITPFTKLNLDDVEYNNEAKETPENENTGIFADKKNVVLIAAESFDDIAIDEQLTPTLYEMSQNGMFFENYHTLSDNTNASEFSFMTSVHPPIDNAKVQNFKGNYNSIPELFNEDDFCTFSFHLNSSNFYKRGELYPELYNFDYSYFSEDLYPDATLNDAKDELLFELSTKFIEEQDCEKNFAYYMSYYGHSAYHMSTRPSATEDFDYVNSVYPENDEYVNAYLAFQMSLDKMAKEMLTYYSEQGMLDDTVFIIVADHYPYALGDPEHQYGEYSEKYVSKSFTGAPYETYNVPFFIYDPSSTLENNQEYMSNVDVLPTIADLFGFEYEYSEGKSAFDQSQPGVVKWLAVENFGMLGEDQVYPSDSSTTEVKNEVEADKQKAAKLYSLFE